jgi:hypothetical protein
LATRFVDKPITWFAIEHNEVEEEDAGQCNESHSPVYHEHNGDAKAGAKETQPFVVIL